MRALRVVVAGFGLAAAVTFGVACSGEQASPPPPSDPVLAQGQEIFNDSCAQCHGKTGNGGLGPKLAGVVAGKYPDIADQEAVISGGRGSMPKFSEQLTPEEIDAVARYTREVLGTN